MASVEQSIEVNVSPGTAYALLTRFEQYPRFMQGVKEVRKLDDRRLRWHAHVAGIDREWDAEITQQVPEQCIAWRSLDGPRIEARIALQPTSGACTRVTLQRDQDGQATDDVRHGAEQDLVRFKQFIEKLGRDSGDWRGREQDGTASHSAAAERAAGTLDPLAGGTGLRATASVAEFPDGPQQAFGADDADNVDNAATLAIGAGGSGGNGAASGNGGGSRAGGRARRSGPRLSLTDMLPALFGRWQDPVTTMRRVSDSVEQAFTVLAQASGVLRGQEDAGGAWSPRIETVQSPDRVLLFVEVPGVPRADITVDARPGRLQVSGLRPQAVTVGEDVQHCSEFRYGRFHRTLALPEDADTEAVSAELRNGVLQVTVLRRPRPATGRVEISEA